MRGTLNQANIRKGNKLFYLLCIGATGAVLLYALWGNPVEGAAKTTVLLGMLLLWLFLFRWTQKNSSGYLILLGIVLVAAGTTFYLYQSEREMATFFGLLEWGAVTFGCSAAAWLCGRYFMLKLLVLPVEMAVMIYCGIAGISIPRWGVCTGLFCVLMLITELTEKGTRKRKEAGEQTENRRTGRIEPLMLVPIFVLLLLGIGFLPIKETPAKWESLKAAWHYVGEKADALAAGAEYLFAGKENESAFSFAGYSEGSSLGGGIQDNDNPQISVKVEQMNAPLYLTGSIYDSYNGAGWEQSEKTKEHYKNRYETLNEALSNSIYTEEEVRELTRLRIGKIRYEGLHTKSLFLPTLTNRVTLPEGRKAEETECGNLRLKKAQGVGFSYQTTFREVDYGNEKIENLLRQKAWKEAPELNEKEKELTDSIYRIYTAVPEEMPARVYALADEITKDADNDYDKLRAIESYLRQFSYSTQIDKVPEGVDPIDYFLFESQTGYCSYFASAMTILGRCEGIPVRYVEGFVTNQVTKQRKNPVMLAGNQAHAWAEGYIANIGWIPLEATPGYEGTFAAWEKRETENAAETGTENGAETGVENGLETRIEAEIAAAEQLSVIEGGQLNTVEQLAEKLTEQMEPEIGERLKKAVLLIGKIILIFAAFIMLSALMVWGRRALGRKRYRMAANIEKWKLLLKRILLIGHLMGEDMEFGDTLGAFREAVGAKLDTESGTLAEFCAGYEAVRFGASDGKKVGSCEEQAYTERQVREDEKRNHAEAYVRELEQQYIAKQNCVRRFFYYLK